MSLNPYIARLRAHMGHEKIILPGARILIENEKGEFLFIERIDTGKIGIPAGSLEEGETIEECIRREVEEETGLKLKEAAVIGISSNPVLESVIYPNGDQMQYFTVEFYSNDWEGELKPLDKGEIKSAAFKEASYLEQLPDNERSMVESLRYYRETGQVWLT